tara:strand:- start:102 stop:704 length:603 start_codon:yes stop_codon:yes gene_type:complete
MAWPTTDATTTALDSGTDDPNIARPQIKLNIENANAMANEFGTVDIASPQNEQLLQYNSAASKWVNATVSTGGGSAGSIGYYECTTAPATGSINAGFTELSDGDNIATLSGTNNITFTPISGNYMVLCHGVRDNTNANSDIPVLWRNTTTNTDFGTNRIAHQGSSFGCKFTANGTDEFSFIMNGTTTNFTTGWILQLIKY